MGYPEVSHNLCGTLKSFIIHEVPQKLKDILTMPKKTMLEPTTTLVNITTATTIAITLSLPSSPVHYYFVSLPPLSTPISPPKPQKPRYQKSLSQNRIQDRFQKKKKKNPKT